MQAVILAAGKGTRLRPLTYTTPKPLLSVGGKPILEYTLRILPKEITEIILIVGYLGEQIKEYFGDKYNGKKIQYANQQEQKGTFDALKLVEPLLEKKFLILFADNLYHPDDLQKLIQYDNAVAVKTIEDPRPFGVCVLNKDGTLSEILEKLENPPTNLVNIGAYILTHDIFKEKVAIHSDGEHLLPPMIGTLARKKKVHIVQSRFWHPISFPKDLAEAEKILPQIYEP